MTQETVMIFEKEYDYEALYDLGRDVSEAMNEEYNECMADLPVDGNGMITGTFKVTIEWFKL
jgi:hypothetical protein